MLRAPAADAARSARDAPPVVGDLEAHRRPLQECAGGRLDVEQLALHDPEPDVSALAGGGSRVPVALQRDGKGGHVTKKRKQYGTSGPRTALGGGTKGPAHFAFMLKQQGLPDDFLEDAPFTATGKQKAIGNGVPLPMGRAIAAAVLKAFPEDP